MGGTGFGPWPGAAGRIVYIKMSEKSKLFSDIFSYPLLVQRCALDPADCVSVPHYGWMVVVG